MTLDDIIFLVAKHLQPKKNLKLSINVCLGESKQSTDVSD